MNVVIVGGNERMVCQYSEICKNYGCNAKIFAKGNALKKKLGCPDLLILFTNTVSHAMVNSVLKEAMRNNVPIARVRSSSATALDQALLSFRAAHDLTKTSPCG
jgi:hypothetical protein